MTDQERKETGGNELLRMLPGVDRVIENISGNSELASAPKSVLVSAIREVIERLRETILRGGNISVQDLSREAVAGAVEKNVREKMTPNLKPAVNATGVVVHTNLGRSILPGEAVRNIVALAEGYSNLEYDLAKGKRGSRYSAVEDIICEISGAESAMVVNNNAGAVFLCLSTMAPGKKVIVSRGELVEIGGSFRIPDVMAASGAILTEVGATNRTHASDYEKAIDEDVALLLKVHQSNFAMVGFTSLVPLTELVALGRNSGIPVMEDLGSGTFIDFSRYGLQKEPTVQDSVSAGVDVVTFSGDKMLGGPQAGIIVGSKEILDRIKKNPMTRALRIDKLTLAALESTIRLYRDPETAVRTIPTLRMLTCSEQVIQGRADMFITQIGAAMKENPGVSFSLVRRASKVGGGALPLLDLPGICVGLKIDGVRVNDIEKKMRENNPPVIGRIEDDLFLMDFRTIRDREIHVLVDAVASVIESVLK